MDLHIYNGETQLENTSYLGERLCLKDQFQPNRSPLVVTTEFSPKLCWIQPFLIHDFQDIKKSRLITIKNEVKPRTVNPLDDRVKINPTTIHYKHRQIYQDKIFLRDKCQFLCVGSDNQVSWIKICPCTACFLQRRQPKYLSARNT